MFENKLGVIGIVIVASVIGTMVWKSSGTDINGAMDEPMEIQSISENTEIDSDKFMPNIDTNKSINIESLSKNDKTRNLMNNQEDLTKSLPSETLVQSANSRADGYVDDIGGYIDESAIAPEDEVPQNNYIDSIGYYDPGAEAPSVTQSSLEEQSAPISIETGEIGKAPEDDS